MQRALFSYNCFEIQVLRSVFPSVGKAVRITCRENTHGSGGDDILEYNAYFDSRGL
jgi:hypothetical protein